MKRCLQPRCRIDETHRVIDEMFLPNLTKKHLSNRLISRRRELHVEQAVRLGINRSVQLEAFVIELDHGLVNRNVIRISTASRL